MYGRRAEYCIEIRGMDSHTRFQCHHKSSTKNIRLHTRHVQTALCLKMDTRFNDPHAEKIPPFSSFRFDLSLSSAETCACISFCNASICADICS